MNKTLRNLALVALVAAPFTAFAEVKGAGTEADPYQIATAADLATAYTLTKNAETVYFVQTADITYTDAENASHVAVCGYLGANYNNPIVYDGKNHVIKGFAPTNSGWNDANKECYGQSVFGALTGVVKNLGIVGATVGNDGGRAGIVCGYFGVNNGNPEALALFPISKLENVYVTGKVNGCSANYTGGLFGTTGTEVEITNCFVNVEMTGKTGGKNGAFAGRINHTATITNCYVAGTVAAAAENGAIPGLVAGANSGEATYDGFVVFNTGSESTGLDATKTIGEITMANTAATKAEGVAEVKEWAAFSATEEVEGLPALNYALSGAGTEANPYIIDCVEALCNAWNYVDGVNGGTYYFVQTADLDMKGVELYHPMAGWNGQYKAIIHYDGDNHVIKNFAPTEPESVGNGGEVDKPYYSCTIFGVPAGSIKNLGVINANCEQKLQGVGVLGAYAGHSKATTLTVENVFVEGQVKGEGQYTGGMFGTTGNTVVISNSFANVVVEGATGITGGLIGRVGNDVEIANVYVAGEVAEGGYLIAGAKTEATSTITASDVIAFNTANGNAVAIANLKVQGDVEEATAANKAALIEAVQEWDGFSATKFLAPEGLEDEAYPILESFEAYGTDAPVAGDDPSTGIFDAALDAAAPAVYYNLQGVQVANPDNGVYIVRRGNKVTKELIRK